MGGSTPILASRVAVLSPHMGCLLTPEEILDDFKSFYFDTALSSYDANLTLAESFVGPDHLLFGTDFPGECRITCQVNASVLMIALAVSKKMTEWYTSHLEGYYAYDPKKLDAVMCENTFKLFPRLRNVSMRGHLLQTRL